MKFIRNPRGRPTHQRVLTVEGGRVMCPRRGVVDIEGCWACPAYEGVSGGSMDDLACSTKPVVMPFRSPGPWVRRGRAASAARSNPTPMAPQAP